MRFKLLVFIIIISINSVNGQSWTNIFPNPSEFNYRGLYMDTTGLGIFVGSQRIITKTSDFGKTFINVHYLPWGSLNTVERISDSVFIAIGSSAVLRSDDAGETWIDLDLNFDKSPMDVKFIDEKRGFIVGHEGLSLMSVDAGLNWEPIHIDDTASFTQINFINDTVGYISGTDTSYFKTINRGETWEEKVLELEKEISFLYFSDEQNGLLFLRRTLFLGYLYRTNDGGETWALVNDNAPTLRNFKFLNDSIGFGANLIGHFFRTEDGGINWTRIFDIGLGHYNGFCIVNEDLIIATTERQGILYSDDQGENWNSLSKFLNEDLTKVVFSDSEEVYITGENGLILKSIDNGLNYIELNTGLDVKWNDIITFEPNKVLVLGDSSTIMQSNNRGKTWEYLFFDYGNFKSVSKINENIWIVSDLGYLLKSNDAGTNWKSEIIATASLPDFVYFISESIGFIIDKNRKVSKTLNGGESWEVIEEINYAQNSCIHFVNDKIGYVAGDRVYKTLDGGETWEILTSNLPIQHQLSMYFRDENIGFISGYYGLIMKTIDGGETWEYNSTFTEQALFSLAFNSLGVGIAVGLNGTIIRTEEEPLTSSSLAQSNVFSELNIYPNPSTDNIYLQSDLMDDTSIIQIFNIQGSFIKQYRGNLVGQTIHIQGLPKGTYIVLHRNHNFIERGIFVKK